MKRRGSGPSLLFETNDTSFHHFVNKNDDSKVYAMKVLKKKHMVKRNQVDHIKTERKIMVSLIGYLGTY